MLRHFNKILNLFMCDLWILFKQKYKHFDYDSKNATLIKSRFNLERVK